MIPVRLEIQNFLAYRAPRPLVFDGIHLACLIGANGAGKSSLLDAITWALWGKARSKRDNEMIHLGADDMYVQLDFLHEGQKYRVVRRRERRGTSGNSRLELFSYDEHNALNEISEGSVKATDKRIIDLLRLDYDTFINSAFLQQGQADSFTVQQPAKRKQILSNILGLEAWTVYEDRAKRKITELEGQIAQIAGRLAEIEEQLGLEESLRRKLFEAQAARDDAEQRKQEAERLLDEVKDAPIEHKNAQDALKQEQATHDRYERELANIKQRLGENAGKIAAYEEVVAERESIQAGYEALQAARTASEELSEKLTALGQLNQRMSELHGTINEARIGLENERDSLRRDIDRHQKQIDTVQRGELDDLTTQIEALTAQTADRDQAQADLQALKEEAATRKERNKTLKVTMNDLKERIDTLADVEGASCPLCGQALTEEHRSTLLAELQAEGKTQGDTYRANLARVEDITAEQKTLEQHIKALTDAIADLPRLQKRQGELQTLANAAAEAQHQLAEAQTRLTEVEGILENATYAQEARAELATVTEQRDALGYDQDQHNENRQALKTYATYEEQHTRLRIAEESLPALLSRQEQDEASAIEQQQYINDSKGKLALLEQQMKDLAAKVVLQRQRSQDFAALNTEFSNKDNALAIAQQELNALDAQRERKREFLAQREALTEQRSIYDDLRTAFGKNGVPAMIIETAIPELENTANQLLSRMTDDRMRVTFNTQREKVTGGVAETLDITIADELGTRPYEMYSGGEAFRINFAIRIALSKMLARRAGAHLETLFIDEGFGTQDEDGRGKLIEAINAVKDEFNLILVITHIDDLKDQFPVHIQVQKTPQGSEVAIV